MSIKLIIFNGPPGCGKDYAINHLCRTTSISFSLKTSTYPREAIINSLGLNKFESDDYYNQYKDVPLEELGGMSFRQAMIAFSEEFMKPKFGRDVFGKVMARDLECIKHLGCQYVFTDCGFSEEIIGLIENVDKDDVSLIQIHRNGHSFDGDSRSYVDPKECGITNLYTILNCGTEEYIRKVDYVFNLIKVKGEAKQ